MRKAITIICTILSALIILDSLQVGDAVMMFLLAGVIPGTNISMGAADTMALFALLIGFVLARVTNRAVLAVTRRQPIAQRA